MKLGQKKKNKYQCLQNLNDNVTELCDIKKTKTNEKNKKYCSWSVIDYSNRSISF